MFKQFRKVDISPAGELAQTPVSAAATEAVEYKQLRPFRDDLRDPQMVFGRCTVTGEWGNCIALDLGPISIEAPDATRGVTLDEDGNVQFSVWNPYVFQNQLTISPAGLMLLLNWSEGKTASLPEIKPNLVYAWQIMFNDGARMCQYHIDPDTGEEVETNTREVDWSQVSQIDIVSHYPEERTLPVYTFITATGKIYKDNVELDLAYDEPMPEDASPCYARHNNHTYSSLMIQRSLSRDIIVQNSKIYQILGWRVGGLGSGVNLCCLIAIDEKGEWRAFEYVRQGDLG